MSAPFFSQHWYRVADLKLRLRSHAQIHRQRFRGRVWYVLQDHQSGHFHRISPAAHLLISLLNGRRTVNEAWEIVGARLRDEQPRQDETIQLLAQLHHADLLRGEVPPDLDELARRRDQQKLRKMLSQARSPLAIRLPLLDPERFLQATSWLAQPVFSRTGLAIWFGVVLSGVVLAVSHWTELTHNVADRVLAPGNLLQIALLYPLIKSVHELGHAYAVRRWGGEVHEIGIMLLVLMPVPYVDASNSTAFRSRWQRAAVAAAGIMTEMLIAALAMMLWVQVEAGLVRAIAFNTMLIAGVSTVLFNGNPLLRYDGYFVLCDLIEIPNLGTRANRYLAYLLQRHVLGIRDALSPVTASGERAWFVGYAVASFIYRALIIYSISVFLISTFMILGVLLALVALINIFIVPVFKGVAFLATSPKLQHHRGRAFARALAATGLVIAPFTLIPLPYATVAEGVVWLPEHAAVRASTEGVVKALLAEPGSEVDAGDALILLEDSTSEARIGVLEADLAELRLRLTAVEFVDRVQADMLRAQIRQSERALSTERQRAEGLTVRAQASGRFVIANPLDLPERFVARGSVIGYVIGGNERIVRVIVDQDDVDLVRRETTTAAVRFVEHLETVVPATIVREVPEASRELPVTALGSGGGGERALDPSAPQGLRTFESFFEFDLLVHSGFPAETLAGRAWVRFDHGHESLARQLYRELRQLFLRQFSV